MKKFYSIIILILLLTTQSNAQYSMDFGINLGAAHSFGEIGGTDAARPFILDYTLQQNNVSGGFFFRYHFTPNIAAKAIFTYARIAGADSLSNNPERIGRNLSFRTDMFEFSILGEYSFLNYRDISRRSKNRIDFSSYAYAGVGALFFYPYAQYKGKWYYLRPLMTEGVENQYDEMTIAVPLGLGVSWTVNKKYKLGFEAGYRFTMTDYLDDVSTDYAADTELPFQESFIFADRSDEAFARGNADLPDRKNYGNFGKSARRGNPDSNDGYLIYQVSFSYIISQGNSFANSRYRKVINRRRKRTKF